MCACRDVKPENILFADDTDASLQLAGFSLASRIPVTSHATVSGTPGYVAPEVLQDKRQGEGMDLWSAGVVLYIMLCGYPPFYHEETSQLFRQIREGRYSFDSPNWDDISEHAKELVWQLLVVDPDRRVTTTAALAHQWLASQ